MIDVIFFFTQGFSNREIYLKTIQTKINLPVVPTLDMQIWMDHFIHLYNFSLEEEFLFWKETNYFNLTMEEFVNEPKEEFGLYFIHNIFITPTHLELWLSTESKS